MKKVTIKDVAKEAGTSISTVSNALNDIDVLRPETKQRILETAERMNYIPDFRGRHLKAAKTNAIGLFISSMRGEFYGILADSMYVECQKYGYELYVYITRKNTTIINNILGRNVDAAVVLYEGVTQETVERLVKSEIPVVFLDREVKGKRASSIVFDSYQEGRMAGEYLLKLGHKSFGHIYGVPGNYDSRQRHEGFVQALKEAGYTMSSNDIIDGHFDKEVAYTGVCQFLETGKAPPDAIFAANDLSALGCIMALTEHGYRIPEDVSVMGCDDIALCQLVQPRLTTIRTSFETMGILVVTHLMELLEKEEKGRIEKIKGSIKERGSCRERLVSQYGYD